MSKCKLCPHKRTCRDACYGDNPCDFAKAFDRLGARIDLKEVCIQSLKAERDAAQKNVLQHRVFGEYVLTPIPNAFNEKTSWWISKRGISVAHYCFTASDTKEIDYQVKEGLAGYIELLEDALKRQQ